MAACDAIVVGGGIAGCSAAGFLAAEGLTVALLERRQVGACQSGLNAGWIRSLGRTRAELPLIQVAMGLWREWASSLALPLTIGGGYSVAADEAGLARLLRWKQLADPLIPGVSLVAGPGGGRARVPARPVVRRAASRAGRSLRAGGGDARHRRMGAVPGRRDP